MPLSFLGPSRNILKAWLSSPGATLDSISIPNVLGVGTASLG